MSRASLRPASSEPSAAVYGFRRATLEQRIEELIALLDLLDGDENLEPELAGWECRCMDDREGDDEREYDEAELGLCAADS